MLSSKTAYIPLIMNIFKIRKGTYGDVTFIESHYFSGPYLKFSSDKKLFPTIISNQNELEVRIKALLMGSYSLFWSVLEGEL